MAASDYRLLRGVLGIIFVVSGVLKIASAGSPEMSQTLVGQLFGDAHVGLIAFSGLEILFGICVFYGIGESVLPMLGVLASIGFAAYTLLQDSPTACGCFGTFDQSLVSAPLWVTVRNAVIGLGLVAVWLEGRRAARKTAEG